MYKENSIVLFLSIACTLLVLLLAVFIVIMIYRYQSKITEQLKSVEELKFYHENALLVSQIEIQEQTFQNIAREVHDNVGQKLSLAKLYLVSLTAKNHSVNEIKDSIDIIGLVLENLRNMSRSMSSDMILNNGFISALDAEINNITKTGLFKIQLLITGEAVFLAGKRELILFRIVQEALQNALKHSKASVINISINYSTQTLKLNMCDNGTGFDTKNLVPSGQGLLNMKKRTEMLGGELILESVLNGGTNLTIRIPINV